MCLYYMAMTFGDGILNLKKCLAYNNIYAYVVFELMTQW